MTVSVPNLPPHIGMTGQSVCNLAKPYIHGIPTLKDVSWVAVAFWLTGEREEQKVNMIGS